PAQGVALDPLMRAAPDFETQLDIWVKLHSARADARAQGVAPPLGPQGRVIAEHETALAEFERKRLNAEHKKRMSKAGNHPRKRAAVDRALSEQLSDVAEHRKHSLDVEMKQNVALSENKGRTWSEDDLERLDKLLPRVAQPMRSKEQLRWLVRQP